MPAVKLHRCGNVWVKVGGHPCWRVQKALDKAGVDYSVAPHRWLGNREEMQTLSGQRKYPVIEFADGSIYREESKDMAATIKSGRLMEKGGRGASGQHGDGHAGHDHDHERSGPPA